MGESVTDKLKGIEFGKSYVLGVIYDDESLTLEMDFFLSDIHPKYTPPAEGEDGCFRQGYIRFADIGDLRLAKAQVPEGEIDYSDIYSAEFVDDWVLIASGWGEIEVTAQSIRIVVD